MTKLCREGEDRAARSDEARTRGALSVSPTTEDELGPWLRAAVASSGEVVILTDREGTILYVNPEFTRVYGFTAEELVGKQTPRVLKSGALPPETYEQFWAAMVNKEVVRTELVNKTKDGRLLHIAGSGNAVLDDRGEIVGFLAIQRDISEERRAAARLRRIQFALDNAPYGVLWADSQGQLSYANDAALKILGHEREALLALRAWDIEDLDADQWSGRWNQLVERGGLPHAEWKLRHGDGHMIPVELAVSHFEHDGREYGCAFFHDISVRKQLTEQLQQAQKMEAIGQLAGGVAHDFNNILTAMASYVSLLQDDLGSADPRRQDANELAGLVQRAADLTQQLLAFSRKQVLHLALVDVDAVVRDLEKMLGRLIGENIELSVSLRSDGATVEADRGQMTQVLMNLAVNARDAMRDGGILEIATYVEQREAKGSSVPAGSYACIAVRDTGCGIEPSVLQHVFEPFFTTKPRGEGTGLGLSTVYGIIKQCGGHIEADSEVGKGSAFTICLPLADGAVAAAHALPPTTAASAGETLLLVEDEAGVRRALERLLSRSGYRVLSASNAGEALLLFEKHQDRIDVVLSDVVLPHVSGVELLTRLKKQAPNLAALLMTGYVDQTVRPRALKQLGCQVLRKPFRQEELQQAIRSALDRR